MKKCYGLDKLIFIQGTKPKIKYRNTLFNYATFEDVFYNQYKYEIEINESEITFEEWIKEYEQEVYSYFDDFIEEGLQGCLKNER